ncbi:unnamed protein product [Caenorhabditis sp. 36 PRJEB53466]|nr:unnamed protein product [Caenorhabditis sp. 36 PRJEB53466]
MSAAQVNGYRKKIIKDGIDKILAHDRIDEPCYKTLKKRCQQTLENVKRNEVNEIDNCISPFELAGLTKDSRLKYIGLDTIYNLIQNDEIPISTQKDVFRIADSVCSSVASGTSYPQVLLEKREMAVQMIYCSYYVHGNSLIALIRSCFSFAEIKFWGRVAQSHIDAIAGHVHKRLKEFGTQKEEDVDNEESVEESLEKNLKNVWQWDAFLVARELKEITTMHPSCPENYYWPEFIETLSEHTRILLEDLQETGVPRELLMVGLNDKNVQCNEDYSMSAMQLNGERKKIIKDGIDKILAHERIDEPCYKKLKERCQQTLENVKRNEVNEIDNCISPFELAGLTKDSRLTYIGLYTIHNLIQFDEIPISSQKDVVRIVDSVCGSVSRITSDIHAQNEFLFAVEMINRYYYVHGNSLIVLIRSCFSFAKIKCRGSVARKNINVIADHVHKRLKEFGTQKKKKKKNVDNEESGEESLEKNLKNVWQWDAFLVARELKEITTMNPSCPEESRWPEFIKNLSEHTRILLEDLQETGVPRELLMVGLNDKNVQCNEDYSTPAMQLNGKRKEIIRHGIDKILAHKRIDKPCYKTLKERCQQTLENVKRNEVNQIDNCISSFELAGLTKDSRLKYIGLSTFHELIKNETIPISCQKDVIRVVDSVCSSVASGTSNIQVQFEFLMAVQMIYCYYYVHRDSLIVLIRTCFSFAKTKCWGCLAQSHINQIADQVHTRLKEFGTRKKKNVDNEESGEESLEKNLKNVWQWDAFLVARELNEITTMHPSCPEESLWPEFIEKASENTRILLEDLQETGVPRELLIDGFENKNVNSK